MRGNYSRGKRGFEDEKVCRRMSLRGLLTAAASAFASGSVQTVLFPVKYVIYGKTATAEGEYATLNYKGRAYVPIRFLAENAGDVVVYDDKTKTITIDDKFPISDTDCHNRKVSNLTFKPLTV
jgi:hypothetical protein